MKSRWIIWIYVQKKSGWFITFNNRSEDNPTKTRPTVIDLKSLEKSEAKVWESSKISEKSSGSASIYTKFIFDWMNISCTHWLSLVLSFYSQEEEKKRKENIEVQPRNWKVKIEKINLNLMMLHVLHQHCLQYQYHHHLHHQFVGVLNMIYPYPKI